MKQQAVSKMGVKAIAVMLITAFGLGLNYVFSIFVARTIGAEAFGLYALGIAVFNVLSVTSVLGLENAILRFLPQAIQKGQNKSEFLGPIILLGGIASVSVAFSLFLISPILANDYFSKPNLEIIIKLLALAIPAFVILALLLAVLQAYHDVKYRSTIRYVVDPLLKFIIAIILLFLGYKLIGIVAAVVGALWISLIIAAFVIITGTSARFTKLEVNAFIKVLSYSLPIAMTVAITIAASRIDIFILGRHYSQLDVALYAAAFQTAAILGIVLHSMESVVAPIFSEQLANLDKFEIKHTYQTTNRWVITLGIPILLVFLLKSTEFLGLYGQQFTKVTYVFQLLVLAQLVNIISGSGSIVLLMGGHSKLSLYNGIISAVILFVMNYILIPTYGLYGAAIAVLSATMFLNTIRVIEVYYIYHVLPFHWRQIKPVAAGGLVVLLYTIFHSWLNSIYWPLVVILIFVLYYGFLILLGLEDEDIQVLGDLYNRIMSN